MGYKYIYEGTSSLQCAIKYYIKSITLFFAPSPYQGVYIYIYIQAGAHDVGSDRSHTHTHSFGSLSYSLTQRPDTQTGYSYSYTQCPNAQDTLLAALAGNARFAVMDSSHARDAPDSRSRVSIQLRRAQMPELPTSHSSFR